MYKVSLLHHNWLAMRMGNKLVREKMDFFRGVVCDLGCGERPFESDILAVADKYVGVDWSNTLHNLWADVVADLNRPLPLGDATADTVISFSVMEHLSEPQTMLDEAYRILRPGGAIVLAVPFQWWVHEAPYDYFRFTRYGLDYMFKKAGFIDIRVEENSGFWTTWFLKINYQSARLVRGPLILRWMVRACLLPLWLSDQFLAPILDRIWPSASETQGYSVTARKV